MTAVPGVLRSRLTGRLGSPSRGMWISTRADRLSEAETVLAKAGLATEAQVFRGTHESGELAAMVTQASDPPAIARQYNDFLAGFAGSRPIDPLSATMSWCTPGAVPVDTSRPAAELLPRPWSGARAAALSRRRHALGLGGEAAGASSPSKTARAELSQPQAHSAREGQRSARRLAWVITSRTAVQARQRIRRPEPAETRVSATRLVLPQAPRCLPQLSSGSEDFLQQAADRIAVECTAVIGAAVIGTAFVGTAVEYVAHGVAPAPPYRSVLIRRREPRPTRWPRRLDERGRAETNAAACRPAARPPHRGRPHPRARSGRSTPAAAGVSVYTTMTPWQPG